MHIDISTLIPAVAFVLYVTFFIFGFLQYRKDRFYWSFQLYMLFMAIWSFGSMMMHLNSPIMTPLFWNRIMLIGLLSVPYALSSFIVDMLGIKKRVVLVLIQFSYVLIIPSMYLNFTGSIVSDAGFTASGEFYYQLATGAMSAYSLSYVYLIITLLLLLFGSKWRQDAQARRNILLPLVGVLVMLVGIFMNIFPELGKYPIDIAAAAVNAVLLFYSIYKFKLVNYSKAGMAIIYSTIMVTVTSVIYLFIFLVIQRYNSRFNPGNVVQLSFILGISTLIIANPLRNLMHYIIDSIIIPRRHPYQMTIRELSRRLTTIVNLKELGEEVVKSLSGAMKSEWVLFATRAEGGPEGRYVVVAQENWPLSLTSGAVIDLDLNLSDDYSILFAKAEEEPFDVGEGIPKTDVVIPLVCRGELSGCILISYDHDMTLISEIERDALDILASQCSLSLENALSFERLRIQGDELVMSNNKLEAIFNGIASPLCLIDINFTIVEANSAALNFVGKDYPSLIGTKCYESLFERTKPCIFCRGLDSAHAGAVHVEEAEVGDHFYSFQFHPVRSDDRDNRVFIEIINDITEQKHLQQELVRTEKMAGIGALASGIAHELNNPLAGIVGTAEILRDESDEEKRSEYLGDILDYARGASDVIKELALYSRQDEPSKLEPVDLVQTLEFSLRLALRGSDASHVEIKRNYHALPTICAKEAELQQLFLNMIVNALQAMKGKGQLTLSCFEDKGYVSVKIMDTGCGIPKANLNQIFTPFYTTKEPGSGTGLGLSNCYIIVERMGGRIRVESQVNKGSEFTIILVPDEQKKLEISFQLATGKRDLEDVFFLQRKVLVGEKGYLEETIRRSEDEKAIHILAFRGLHPVGTVSLMTSEHFWPLPISSSFDIDQILKTDKAAEIIRLAVLPQMRNTSASIGLIILVFLLARALGVEELVIDVFSSDVKTIHLYRKFGFVEVGSYNSPSEVTVMVLQEKSTLEVDQGQLKHFVRPLFRRLRGRFDFGNHTEAVHEEMDRILSSAE